MLGFCLFFIVGAGHRTAQPHGTVFTYECPHCHNAVGWRHTTYRHWVTLFFVPVFPYKSEVLIECPICGAAYDVTGWDPAEMRRLADRLRRESSGDR